MSSSSDTFRPLAAQRVDAAQRVADVPTQRTARGNVSAPAWLSVVPAQRELVGRDDVSVATLDVLTDVRPTEPKAAGVRPAFAAPVELAARAAQVTTTEPVPARFVPLVEPDEDPTVVLATREQARAAGFAAGFAAGSREAAKVAAVEADAAHERAEAAEAVRADEHAQAMASLAAAVRAACSARVPVLDAVEDRLHAAALELATAVLGLELSDAPTAARAVLARAATAGVGTQVVVRMNPRDADAVVAPEGMRVVVDPTLSHGDAVVEHGDGELDARLTTALDRARAVLVEATAGETAEPFGAELLTSGPFTTDSGAVVR